MKIKLNVEETINNVILGEIKQLIEFKEAPFIKFQLIVTSIEFLGACLDQHDFADNSHSEERFNTCLNKLFPKVYKKYAKNDSSISLYKELRCGMIHKLKPLSSKVRLTERRHIKNQKVHMEESNGDLYIVLEDFFDDLVRACNKLKELSSKKKLPTQKMKQGYIIIEKGSTGHTETNISIDSSSSLD